MARTDQPHKKEYRNVLMVQMREYGRTWTEIGREFGVSPQRAFQVVTRELKRREAE